jgi:cathepsin L
MFDLSVQQMAMCAPNPSKTPFICYFSLLSNLLLCSASCLDHCGGSGGCAGATAELAFDYVTGSTGLYQEYQYSYTSYYGKDAACTIPSSGSPVATIDGYVTLPFNNYTALMNAIATVGPIAVSVDASAWSSYESGIFDNCNQNQPDIDHAVVLVGYGEESNGSKFWIIRNSWSPSK